MRDKAVPATVLFSDGTCWVITARYWRCTWYKLLSTVSLFHVLDSSQTKKRDSVKYSKQLNNSWSFNQRMYTLYRLSFRAIAAFQLVFTATLVCVFFISTKHWRKISQVVLATDYNDLKSKCSVRSCGSWWACRFSPLKKRIDFPFRLQKTSALWNDRSRDHVLSKVLWSCRLLQAFLVELD